MKGQSNPQQQQQLQEYDEETRSPILSVQPPPFGEGAQTNGLPAGSGSGSGSQPPDDSSPATGEEQPRQAMNVKDTPEAMGPQQNSQPTMQQGPSQSSVPAPPPSAPPVLSPTQSPSNPSFNPNFNHGEFDAAPEVFDFGPDLDFSQLVSEFFPDDMEQILNMWPNGGTTTWTRGYFAYRYQKKYYRRYLPFSANLSSRCEEFAGVIPRDTKDREAWILETIQTLENDITCRRECEIPDQDGSIEFTDIRNDHDWMLPLPDTKWTYVTDLDNRVFTVNGVFHIKFDNMPPVNVLRQCLEANEGKIKIPPEHLTTISLWPESGFDISGAKEQYDKLQPIIASLAEWGAPTWDALSVAQHLSTQLVHTVLDDYSDKLAAVQFPQVQRRIGLFCWRIICAAAPSNLLCPPEDITPVDGIRYILTDQSISRPIPTVPFRVVGEGLLHRYCWFRNCLITFCSRLDEPIFMMHEVNLMVKKLLDHGHTGGVGLIVSHRQIVAVAVNGSGPHSEVRQTPVLAFHDDGELKDGLLLMMHLLSPTLPGVSKTPWFNASSPWPNKSSATLPLEILEHIIQFTDFDTYLRLPLVSKTFRTLCFMRPRVGHHILLAKEPGQSPVFKVQRAGCASRFIATLTRIKPTHSFSQYDAPWGRHHIGNPTLLPALGGSFQHRRVGTDPTQTLPDKISKVLEKHRANRRTSSYLVDLGWEALVSRAKTPEMRVQAVDGVWRMTETGPEVRR